MDNNHENFYEKIKIERVFGYAPKTEVWKTSILLLNYTRRTPDLPRESVFPEHGGYYYRSSRQFFLILYYIIMPRKIILTLQLIIISL